MYRDPSAALQPIDDIIKGLIDFRKDSGENVRGGGAKALVQQRVGKGNEAEVEWVERDHGNAVLAGGCSRPRCADSSRWPWR